MISPEIHWHEGLFLLPQHFQTLSRAVGERFAAERNLSWAYPYGVLEARLSHDDLENFRLRFERLRVVMPGGCVISYPENAELPSLDIREAFASNPKGFTVYLGVPDWFEARPNVIEGDDLSGTRVKVRYRVTRDPIEVNDENTGEGPRPIQIRRFNAVLLLEGDDASDVDRIPLLRIVHDTSREQAVPRQDPGFVHPCLLLSASPTIREMVRDLTGQVSAVREQLANVVARGGDANQMGRLQIEQLLRLRSLNRFIARIPSLLDVGDGAARVPPLQVYIELRSLLAELMALFPERGGFDLIPYRHEDPLPSFQAVISQIRNYLHGAVAPDFWKVDFVAEKDGVRVAMLEDKHVLTPTAWFLGIKTTMEPSALVDLVEDTDQFKLMPRSYLERAIRGVLLKEERFPPLELPADSGRYYFRLQTTQSRRIWQEAEREKELVIRWSMQREVADLNISLYMTLPSGGADLGAKGLGGNGM